MLANVVEIDHIAHMMALTEDSDPTLILHDFTAAFPSLSREFAVKALAAFGAPAMAITTMNNFHTNNTLHLRLHGQQHDPFEVTRGIRQGCPLSPLIFAIATDSLLRNINMKLPEAQLSAFADDTAAAIPSWNRHSKKLHKIMSTYSNITKWTLTPPKPLRLH